MLTVLARRPVARWHWGHETGGIDAPPPFAVAVRAASTMLGVLARAGVAEPQTPVEITALLAGNAAVVLLRETVTLHADMDTAAVGELLVRIDRDAEAGPVGSVDIWATCPAVVSTATGIDRQQGGFRLNVGYSAPPYAYLALRLDTYTDVWLPFDLRARPQPDVFARNAPRLAAALTGMAAAFGVETDPEDEDLRYATATPTGVANYLNDDGSVWNVWSSFVMPDRDRIFTDSRREPVGYNRDYSGPMTCVPVLGAAGILGYLWASDEAGAASFEPTEDAEDAGYEAGVVWLERLAEAHRRGLTPTQAVAELAGTPGTVEAGNPNLDQLFQVRDKTDLLDLV